MGGLSKTNQSIPERARKSRPDPAWLKATHPLDGRNRISEWVRYRIRVRTHNKATYTPCIISSVSLETQDGWGEKVGQTETKSVKELDGNVLFGEESLKTGGKDFHRAAPFVEGRLIRWFPIESPS